MDNGNDLATIRGCAVTSIGPDQELRKEKVEVGFSRPTKGWSPELGMPIFKRAHERKELASCALQF